MATSAPTASYGGNVSSNVVEVANAPQISNTVTFPDQSGALQALAQAWGTGAQAQAQAQVASAYLAAQATVQAATVAASATHEATVAQAGQGSSGKLLTYLALAAAAAGAWFLHKHKGALA